MRGHRHSTIVPASVGPWIRAFATFAVLLSPPAFADPINGRVAGGGAPIAGSTVTLWAASAGLPRQLAETRTDTDGRFNLNSDSSDAMLYLTAKGGQPVAAKTGGDNPAITMLAVIGSKPPTSVVINEMTTIASVWTHVQFLNGDAIKGNPLGIKIAAGNVPNFADLQSGGWGTTIQDSLNKTYTMQLYYDNPASRWVAGVGRLYLPWAVSLDTVDGGYFARKFPLRNTTGPTAGTAGKANPDVPD